MVGIVQLVERQIVVLVVAGSSPTTHPINKKFSVKGLRFFVTMIFAKTNDKYSSK